MFPQLLSVEMSLRSLALTKVCRCCSWLGSKDSLTWRACCEMVPRKSGMAFRTQAVMKEEGFYAIWYFSTGIQVWIYLILQLMKSF
jgi:hypothetical protein